MSAHPSLQILLFQVSGFCLDKINGLIFGPQWIQCNCFWKGIIMRIRKGNKGKIMMLLASYLQKKYGNYVSYCYKMLTCSVKMRRDLHKIWERVDILLDKTSCIINFSGFKCVFSIRNLSRLQTCWYGKIFETVLIFIS